MTSSNTAFNFQGHEPEKVYYYEDEHGDNIGAVARYAPGTLDAEKKTFRQYRFEDSSYLSGLNGAQLPLYRLPLVLAAVEAQTTIYLVEGEQCVHALADWDLRGTTSPGGAGKWRDVHTQHLAGADVVILPDHDEPGRAHGQTVAAALHGVARRVRVLDLPDLEEHGDIVNWVADGHGRTELLNLLNGLEDWRPDEEWPEPIPFSTRSKGEPFPVAAALPPAMQEFAVEASQYVGVDVAAVATALPVVLSAAAGNSFSVRVKEQGYEEPCLSRYVLVSARPGERKTATFRMVTAPLAQWASEERQRWREEAAAVEAHNSTIAERLKELRRKAARAEGDRLDQFLQDVVECEELLHPLPRRPVAFSSDITSPALVRMMHANGGAHAVFSGDGRTVVDQILGQHRGDRRADDAIFVCAHGGDSFDRGRVGTDGGGEYLEIEHSSLAVCVFVQPDKLGELAGCQSLLDSGFIARLNLVRPSSRVGFRLETGHEPPFPERCRQQWVDAVLPIIRLRFDVVDREGPFDPIRLTLSTAAMEARRLFYNEVETRQREGQDLFDVNEFASKMAGEAARLAALFHLCECARLGQSPEEHRVVSIECWQWAEEHQRWQLDETLRVLGLAVEDEDDRLAQRLLNYVARDSQGRSTVSPSDVVSFKVARTVEDSERLLRLLAKRGWVREVPAQKRQRRPRWEFNPLVWVEPLEVVE